MLRRSKIVLALFFVSILMLMGSAAMAEEAVTVEVRTIYASAEGEDCDEALGGLCGRLERGFGGYSSFQQLAENELRIAGGNSKAMSLPTGSTVRVSFHGKEENFVRLGLAIDDRLNTTLRATPGSTFFQAGLRHREGILILAITVE